MSLSTLRPYRQFEERIFNHRKDLLRTLETLKADGKLVIGYRASTKGNVVLQFCGIDSECRPCIAEVNPDKFGCVTPCSHIPIISEDDANKMDPDYMLVLPWYVRDNIVRCEAKFLARGSRFIFPFPEIEIV